MLEIRFEKSQSEEISGPYVFITKTVISHPPGRAEAELQVGRRQKCFYHTCSWVI